MRYAVALLIIALAALGVIVPEADPPTAGSEVATEETPVSVCAVEEGSGRSTELSVVSTVDGPVSLSLFASGSTSGSITQRTGSSGALSIPVVDIAAVGTVGGLLELPSADTAAGSTVLGAESLSVEACDSIPEVQTFLTGATTAGAATFELHMMNPYAGEAVVDLSVQSEAGVESNSRFEAVIVPPRSSAIIDFTELVPGRETLSVTIEAVRGRVVSVGRQGIDGESAVWRSVATAENWFLPVPAGNGRKLIIGTPAATEVEYQVDIYAPGGLDEAVLSGVLNERGQAIIDLDEFAVEPLGARVVSAGPVVASLWSESDGGLAVTTGSPDSANQWFLPGVKPPEGGYATVVVMNVGIDSGVVGVRPLSAGSVIRNFELDADSVLELALDPADGYLIESVSATVPVWTVNSDTASSLAVGVPLSDE